MSEKSHGREEIRLHIVCDVPDELIDFTFEWKGLKKLCVAVSFRSIIAEQKKEPEMTVRYYISSADLTAGMGSGGTTALRPPGKFCFIRPLLRSDLICIRLKIFSHPPKQLRRCKVKPHGSLVPVSSTHRCAYTPGLSTSSSSTFLPLQQSGGEDGGSVVFPPVLVQMLDRLESEILADRVSEESRRWLASCGLTVEQMQNQMDPVYTPARKIHLYHCDHRGLPLALISTEGATAWCAEYDEWGNLLNEENPHQLQQLIRLPGQQYDEESGLYYNRHRYYDPLQGRYITQDPIGLKGGWNFYQYPLNPVTNTDPLGLEVFPRPFPLPIPWPKSPAQQQADDNAAKALTKWWNDTASQRIFDSLILNNPGLALDITMIASRGNVADTGITDRVNDIINDRFWSDGKKPDRCDVLQELIDCGDISAKDAKSTQKAWNCRHSRQSNDKKR